jgi:hypothetical protein
MNLREARGNGLATAPAYLRDIDNCVHVAASFAYCIAQVTLKYSDLCVLGYQCFLTIDAFEIPS